jgi:hypothetical protein
MIVVAEETRAHDPEEEREDLGIQKGGLLDERKPRRVGEEVIGEEIRMRQKERAELIVPRQDQLLGEREDERLRWEDAAALAEGRVEPSRNARENREVRRLAMFQMVEELDGKAERRREKRELSQNRLGVVLRHEGDGGPAAAAN